MSKIIFFQTNFVIVIKEIFYCTYVCFRPFFRETSGIFQEPHASNVWSKTYAIHVRQLLYTCCSIHVAWRDHYLNPKTIGFILLPLPSLLPWTFRGLPWCDAFAICATCRKRQRRFAPRALDPAVLQRFSRRARKTASWPRSRPRKREKSAETQ